MFNDTKYTKWYWNIIRSAQLMQRKKCNGEYFESHHIIPKSLGGSNAKSNLVLLTAKEHYMCHLLLPKMCNSSDHKRRMVYAYMQLSCQANKYRVSHQYHSRSYERFRLSYVEDISGSNCYMYGVSKTAEQRSKISQTRIANSTGAGNKNPMFGKKHTSESKAKMSEVKKLRIQERGVSQHRDKQITANPRSRSVVDHEGNVFPSVSAAGRHYGYKGAQGVRCRIQRGEWKYV